jgi:hypothetical protein
VRSRGHSRAVASTPMPLASVFRHPASQSGDGIYESNFSLRFLCTILNFSDLRKKAREPEVKTGGLATALKVVGNEKTRGVGNLATVRRWFRTVAIDDCLNFIVAFVFSSSHFHFLFVKLS